MSRTKKAPKRQTPPNAKKQRVQRSKDPMKLVLERYQEGKGVVLAPVQTMVLAKYLMQLNAMLEMALKDNEADEQEDGNES